MIINLFYYVQPLFIMGFLRESAMLYGMECWAVKNQPHDDIIVANMRILFFNVWSGRRDRIMNDIRDRVG
jgi:hypothetical protein